MVGIVVVSHSEPLARAAVELAMQMAGDDPPVIEVAAGSDGGLGTDAAAVAEAIQRADASSAGTGVLVITDLGSAVLSAEMALELTDGVTSEVLLSRAPFVEGLVAAVVQASMGRPLDAVEAEAVRSGGAKADQLGPAPEGSPLPSDAALPTDGAGAAPTTASADSGGRPEAVHRDVEIVNVQGLHARPAALFAKAAADQPIEVTVTNLDTGQGPVDADSMIELMSLGVRVGNRVRLSAEGPDAAQVLNTLAQLITEGLGEGVAPGP